MIKILSIILVVGLVFLLNGCNKPPVTATQTEPPASTVPAHYRIAYQWTMLSNDSVGNDWEKTVTCNGQAIANGHMVTAESGSAVIIHGTVTEKDKHADTGSDTITLVLADGARESVRIIVREEHGAYAGNTAEWELTCRAYREE